MATKGKRKVLFLNILLRCTCWDKSYRAPLHSPNAMGIYMKTELLLRCIALSFTQPGKYINICTIPTVLQKVHCALLHFSGFSKATWCYFHHLQLNCFLNLLFPFKYFVTKEHLKYVNNTKWKITVVSSMPPFSNCR